MEVYTTQPGVQFYTANFLNGTEGEYYLHHSPAKRTVLQLLRVQILKKGVTLFSGKAGTKYNKHSSFCLETQNYPDAVNKVGEEHYILLIIKVLRVHLHVTINN